MFSGSRIRFQKPYNVLRTLSTPASPDGPSVRPAENICTSSGCGHAASHSPCLRLSRTSTSTQQIHLRKDNALPPRQNRAGFPQIRRIGPGRRRTSCPASLTVEAALELPFFLLCMILILHYSIVCRACSEFSGKMAQTAEQLALFSYSQVYDDSSHILRGALSDAYAHSQVVGKAQDKGSVKNASFLLSSFLKEDSKISLVLTYQVKSPVSIISPPWTIFLQKMTIRGWTGKNGVSGEAAGSNEDSGKNKEVYVTDSGSVYHTDPDCTHLKLTVSSIPRSKLKTVRNYRGSKYKRCKYCGRLYPDSSNVLIDPYGDTYHTSASCQGLKRTVNAVHLDDISGMRECSDCARRRKQQVS